MMSQEQSNVNTESKPSETPLGKDPLSEIQKKPETLKQEVEIKGKTLADEEYAELMRKASGYDLISNDPQLAQQVADHFRAKTGRATLGSKPEKPQENQQSSVDSRDETIKALQTRLAQLEVNTFRREHPDMVEVESDMARLVVQHGHSLEDAYKFAKAAKQLTSQNAQNQAKPAIKPTSETTRIADTSDTDSDSELANLRKRIDDPKATPHLDDAIELAYKTAKHLQKQE